MSASEQRAFDKAMFSLRAGQGDDAEHEFRKLLKRNPSHLGALNLLGVLLTQTERFGEAETYLRRAAVLDGRSETTHYNHGVVLKNLGRPADAIEAFSRALAINPSVPESWNNRGTAFNDIARYDEAIGDFERALSLKPDYAEALCNKGRSLAKAGRGADALTAYADAARLKPGLMEAWVGQANVYAGMGCDDLACDAFRTALQINAGFADAWTGYGHALARLRRSAEADVAYGRALAIKPNHADALAGRGFVLAELGRHDEAAAAYAAAQGADPAMKYVWGSVLHCRAHAYLWDGLEAEWSRLIDAMRAGAAVTMPFPLLATAASAQEQLICARQFSATTFARVETASPRVSRAPRDRIRVGYFSQDFRDHPVMQLMAGVFEQHDRARFETLAISYGSDDGSAVRKRVSAAFDRFVDVSAKPDPEIAGLLRDLEIDILVDLQGHTSGARTNVLALRPAPVQVNYLGYAGTIGAEFIDYIIADTVVIPPEHHEFYSEKVVYLPDSYLPSDAGRQVSETTMSRSEAGLPEQGFVFCSFNNNFKLTSGTFDVWMRLLRAVERSVLWVRDASAASVANLRSEAQKRGVAPERLVFAPKVARNEDHLARHRLADLFLDTPHYNAHTTGSDALWAGLPMLTCLGSTFAGRVGASLLKAADLPELIAPSLDDYERLAVALAHDRARLGSLRERLLRKRSRLPLFDTARMTRHLEAAYRRMWDMHLRGMAPEAFAVQAITPSSAATA